jgi:chromosome segregation and condensation protein ScpB
MIEHVGELSGAGITAYYKVTPNYLRRLGVKSISELPSIDDLRSKTNMA